MGGGGGEDKQLGARIDGTHWSNSEPHAQPTHPAANSLEQLDKWKANRQTNWRKKQKGKQTNILEKWNEKWNGKRSHSLKNEKANKQTNWEKEKATVWTNEKARSQKVWKIKQKSKETNFLEVEQAAATIYW